MEVIKEANPCLTSPLRRDIGGQICKEKRKNMCRNMTSVKDLLPTFISQGAFLILSLVPGLLLSGAWTLWDPSPRHRETGDGSRSALITSPSGLKLSY